MEKISTQIQLSNPDFNQFCDLSDRQKEARNLGIGGSDASAVMKLSRYSTPLDIYKQKLGGKSSFSGNMRTAVGSFMEDFVRKMVSQMSGIEFIKPHKNLRIFHKKYPWMRCNLDLITKDKSIIGEVKVVVESDDWGEEGTDEMPTEYLIQCAHNRVSSASHFNIDYKEFHLFVLITKKWGDPVIKHYIYRKNEKFETNMIGTQKHFWLNYVEKEVEPPFFTLKEASHHFDDVKDDSMIADELTLELYERHKTLTQEIKALKNQDEMVKVQIAQNLSDKNTLLNFDGKPLVTWKPQTANKFDTTRFKSDKPELYLAYTKQSHSRPMRFM